MLMEQGETFIDYIGPAWIRIGPDGATVLLEVHKQHTNPNGSVHGGVLMTLMDVALGSSVEGVLANAQPQGHPITMQFSCNLVGAARLGELLRLEAQVDRLTRSVGFASGRISVGDKLVMTASAVFKNPSVPQDGRPRVQADPRAAPV